MDNVKEYITRFDPVWNEPDGDGCATSRIPHTALLGNGDLGAFSRSDREKIAFSFSKSDFWEFGGSPLAIGTAAVAFEEPSEGFRERLSLYGGFAETELDSMKAESFVCFDRNVFVMTVTALKKGKFTVYAEAEERGDRTCLAKAREDGLRILKYSRFPAPGDNHAYTVSAAADVNVIAPTAPVLNYSQSYGGFALELEAGDRFAVVIHFSCGKGDFPFEPEYDGERAGDDLEALSRAHTGLWKDYWSASFVEWPLDDERLERIMRFYYGAQYLLGAGVREGKTAPGLYGIWHSRDDSPWSSDYHLNYNFVASFYGSSSSNRPGQLLPACGAVSAFVPEGERRAADLTQLVRLFPEYSIGRFTEGFKNAVLFPVGIAPYGVSDNSYWHETMNAAYSAAPMIDYYRATLDGDFRREVLCPYLEKVISFLEQWICRDGGEAVLFAGYNEGSKSKDPAVELSVYKMCLREAIAAGEAGLFDAETVCRWRRLQTALAPQPTVEINGKKVLSLAYEELPEYGSEYVPLESALPEDGNAIPLDYVLPGGFFGFAVTPKEREVIKNTAEYMLGSEGLHNINNFPRLFTECVDSGVDCETVINAMNELLEVQLMPNLTVDDGCHGLEKCGAVRTVNDMMLRCSGGILELFPNWLADKDAAFRTLRADGAFLVSARYCVQSKKVTSVSVKSEKGGTLRLKAFYAGTAVRDSEGKSVRFAALKDETAGCEVIELETEAGKTYFFDEV